MNKNTLWIVNNNVGEILFPLKLNNKKKIEELPEKAPFALILQKGSEKMLLNSLKKIRSIPNYKFVPIFHQGEINSPLVMLFDGPANDTLIARAMLIHENIRTFGPHVTQEASRELTLLAYLYSRKNSIIYGHASYKTPYIYEFPLLNVLLSDEPSFDQWQFLQDLSLRNFLLPSALLDEITTCNACHSGLLNLKYSCPSCHSIHIKPQKFIHCYACGQIGPVPEFLREERLICSRCKTRLYELGVDYEKPKEDKLCNNCGHFFAEAQLELLCLICQHTSLPDDLISRGLYEYTLTRQAEYWVRGIQKKIYQSVSHYFNVIDHDVFMEIANWQVKLAQRYSGSIFSILSLEISNENDLIETVGDLSTERIMGEFFTHLCQVFRDTDLCSRSDNIMFFFLPTAEESHCLIIIERIKKAVHQLASENIAKGLKVNLSYLTSTEIVHGGLQGEIVGAELQARVLESNICLIDPNSA